MKVRNISGSIIVRKTSSNKEKLYITFKGKQVSTGLPNTEYGKSEARKILKQLNEEERNHRFNIKPEKDTLTVSQAFDKFLAQKKKSRDKKTIEWYECSYKAFFPIDFPVHKVERRNGVTISWLELNIQEMITRQAKSSATLAIYVRGTGVFVHWLYEEGYISFPVRLSRLKKMIKNAPKKPIRVYNEEEIQAICEQLRQDETYKDLAFCIEIMVATGMRIHEVLELTWNAVKKDIIEIESKDKRSIQLISRSEQVNKILEKIPRKPLQNKVFKWSQESDSRLRQALYTAMKNANIERDGRSFHEFRKTFITRLIVHNKKMNIFDIASAARCEIRIIQQHYLKYPTEQLELLLNS